MEADLSSWAPGGHTLPSAHTHIGIIHVISTPGAHTEKGLIDHAYSLEHATDPIILS